ncbi:NAD(P)-binding protein [Auriculariales sp. MPI-PUGE-AT-0066]|nr:NAD(P)-binding protein [Auriculariales sp. MPI-PUGE-AT-0066]
MYLARSSCTDSTSPQGVPVPGQTTKVETTETIDLEQVPLNGGFLREIVCFGIETHMAMQMKPNYRLVGSSSLLCITQLRRRVMTHIVAKVIRSEHSKFKPGDYIGSSFNGLVKYLVVESSDVGSWDLLSNERNLPWTSYLGATGMPGRTAYFGYRLLTESTSLYPAKKGETAYISTAAGPHGSLLIQMFKTLGLKVIGSAGSAEKVAYLKELGCDVAFSYKQESVHDVLKREGPIDIYWDNVGGATLDTAVEHMNKHGRIVICGFTASYEAGKAAPFLNMLDVMYKSITVHGFFFLDFAHAYEADFQMEFVPRIANGELRYQERIVHGFEAAEQALVDVVQGNNFGKTVVVL